MTGKVHGKKAVKKAGRQNTDNARRYLSADALFTLLRKGFERISDYRPPRKRQKITENRENRDSRLFSFLSCAETGDCPPIEVDHLGSRQRPLPKVQAGMGAGGFVEHRDALPAVLFAQPQLDRTALEVREEAGSVLEVLRRFRLPAHTAFSNTTKTSEYGRVKYTLAGRRSAEETLGWSAEAGR